MLPIDVQTTETVTFVESRVNLAGCHMLEVGCGKGEVAELLKKKGVNLRAIDISEKAIDFARQRGIDAVCADLLTYEDEPFDVVLFTRSLHHIHPVTEAVNKAHSLLKSDGLLLAEDFAAELPDLPTLSWRAQTEKLLRLAGVLKEENGHEHRHEHTDLLENWRVHHFVKHSVADSAAMQAALSSSFPDVEQETAPYMYRYIVDLLIPDKRGSQLAEQALVWEKELIHAGSIKPIGLRFIARNVESPGKKFR